MTEDSKKTVYTPTDPRGLNEPFLPVSIAKQIDLPGNDNVSGAPLKVSGRYITKEYDMGTSRNEKIQAILNPLKSKKKNFGDSKVFLLMFLKAMLSASSELMGLESLRYLIF